MEKFTQFIVKNNKIIILIFLIITVICGILAVGVKVNYNLEDYLPNPSLTVSTIIFRSRYRI